MIKLQNGKNKINLPSIINYKDSYGIIHKAFIKDLYNDKYAIIEKITNGETEKILIDNIIENNKETTKTEKSQIKIYLPETKTKTEKSNIRGFWRNEKNKVFYDYIKIIPLQKINVRILGKIARQNNQEAIFYKIGNNAFIFTRKNYNIIQLKKKYIFFYNGFKNLKNNIKNNLTVHKGITIFKNNEKYSCEIWR